MPLKRNRQVQSVSTRHMHCCLEIELDESRVEIFREINVWERFIDEACVELNVEVKTAENEVQDSKWRRDSMCWGGGACGEQKVKTKL